MREIRRIIADEVGDLPARILLFGSRARGDARPASDVDVAILPSAPLPPGLLPRIRDRLEESCIPFHVDVVDLSEADGQFRSAVLEEAVPWTD